VEVYTCVPCEVRTSSTYKLVKASLSEPMEDHRRVSGEVQTSSRYENKAIPLAGCGSLWRCETSRIPHLLDEVLALRVILSLHPRKFPGTRFSNRISLPKGNSILEGLERLKKCSNLVASRTCHHPVWSVFSQETTLQRIPSLCYRFAKSKNLEECRLMVSCAVWLL
jgi:hypothetical protein